MPVDKTRFALWIGNQNLQLVQDNYLQNNCKTQSEYIEKAIRFYTAYLHAQHAEEFLPHVLADTLEGHLNEFGNRVTKILYKQAVEHDMVLNVLAHEYDILESKLQALRAKSVRDVNRTNGNLSFADALKFQRGE